MLSRASAVAAGSRLGAEIKQGGSMRPEVKLGGQSRRAPVPGVGGV